MLLPSGIQPESGDFRQATEIATGLFAVEHAYEGRYDFFAPSPLDESADDAPPASAPVSVPTAQPTDSR